MSSSKFWAGNASDDDSDNESGPRAEDSDSEDCDDEVPVKVVPLYEPFAQHTCTESAVGPLKTSIRQMPTELKPAKLDVRVGVFADPKHLYPDGSCY